MKSIPLPVVKSGAEQSSADLETIARELDRLKVGDVRFDRHNRLLYSTDASLYQVEPIGVVIPESTEAVEKVLRYCAARHLAVLPRGGGTSLAGQCTSRAIVIDLSANCRALLEVDVARRRCRVEPGISIDELNRQLLARRAGLFFAPDPATAAQASIGGCIANNAAGARSIRYGRTSENVLGLDILLSGGERVRLEREAGRRSQTARRLSEQVAAVARENAEEIRRRFPRLVRRNAGYALDLILQQLDQNVADTDLDLCGLLCGSEGTLGIVVAADLKLSLPPVARGLAVVSFPDLDVAIDAVGRILPTGPSAIELLDEAVLRSAEANAECRPYLDLLPKFDGHSPSAVLYVEYEARESRSELAPLFESLRELFPGLPMADYTDAVSTGQAWALRRASEALLHGLPGKAKPVTFVEDNSVPVEQLRRFVSEFRQIVTRHGTVAAYYAHASVGVLHIRPMLDLHEPDDRRKMVEIAVEAADLARSCGGVMSGEHGDGRVRGPLLESFYGPRLIAAFARVKAIFDPSGILNPGNIVNPLPLASIAQNLRADGGNGQVDPGEIDTFYHYAGEEGFKSAVELCNGAGFCRKTTGGVMCPSYRATLDERHSTRGRANAIRLAVTGQTNPDRRGDSPDWEDAGVLETLDLCLSCKACRTECPSNVDVAQLKSEYYAQRHRLRGGPPLAARAVGNVRLLNRLGSALPTFANAVIGFSPARRLMQRALGLAPQRRFPTFSPSLYHWFGKRAGTQSQGKPRVAVWADCFVTYNEPHIGRAAIAVLESLGYAVELPKIECCGRPMISTGMLSEAARTIDRTLGKLSVMIGDDTLLAIIVLEPSCLSALRDEWLKLKPRTDLPARRQLAAKSFSLEEFIEKQWDRHPLLPRISEGGIANRDILVHGHCHQKALWGMGATTALLRRVVGDRLRVLDSGCCGMAGSFGFSADKYELSMRIGELSVFPPVRAAPADALLIAPGVSCRQQIRDGTGRQCLHPAELLARAMVKEYAG